MEPEQIPVAAGRVPEGRAAHQGLPAARRKLMAAGGGVLPKDVMLAAMRKHFRAGRLDDAARIASLVAPYIHPRLTRSRTARRIRAEVCAPWAEQLRRAD